MVNGYIKSYNLKSSFVDRNQSGDMRQFQEDLMNFVKSDEERVAILDTPTGSGKTYSFKNIGNEYAKTIIVLPNNLLAKEVAKDFGNNSVILNKESILEQVKKRKITFNLESTSISETIAYMINDKSHIITNPTVFYYLIINHYNQLEKEDMITKLVKENLKTVIFDEFHIYSKDQILMIIACAMILPNRIKIIFSSATPPDYFFEFTNGVFGKEKVRYISIKRHYERNEKGDLIQGPINLNIVLQNTIDFLSKNKELLKEGYWVLILDSIRNVDQVGKFLIGVYPKDSIAFISAYYDPYYRSYNDIKNEKKEYRIIISTNIIEQGININKKYTNFIIEPGQSVSNLIQRLGRVGRGNEEASNVYVCLPSGFNTPDEDVQNIEQAYNLFKKMNYGTATTKPKAFGVGVYIGFLLEKLSFLAADKIFRNLINYKNDAIMAGIYSVKNIEDTFSNEEGLKIIRKKCFSEIMDIKKWFDNYRETLFTFINEDSKKMNIIDYDDSTLEDNFLRTEYSLIWIMKNKVILNISDDGAIVGGFNEKPNYDFKVRVLNLPDGSRIIPYPEVAFRSKGIIMETLNQIMNDMGCEENEKMQKLKNAIISVVRETAGIERLKLEVIDER